MGTRGFYGFVVKGEEKIGYTHWGGCPDGVGLDVLHWARAQAEDAVRDYPDWDAVREHAAAVRAVTNDVEPTPEDIEKLKPWTDLGVSQQSTSDWYCLLRHAQGDMDGMLTTGYVMDNSTFPLDSLFCEGGALVDLDAMTFEYYGGFVKEPHEIGRFGARSPGGRDGYFPCKLSGSWPLDALPSDEDFLAATADQDDED